MHSNQCPDLSNNGEACSFSNCFVASSLNGVNSAPITGPCPHNHGFYPIGSHAMPTLHIQPSDYRNLGANLPPPLPSQTVSGQLQNYPFNYYYSPHPPSSNQSHGHNYAPYQIPPMNPSHQRLLLSHQRIGEQQRRSFMRHQQRATHRRLDSGVNPSSHHAPNLPAAYAPNTSHVNIYDCPNPASLGYVPLPHEIIDQVSLHLNLIRKIFM